MLKTCQSIRLRARPEEAGYLADTGRITYNPGILRSGKREDKEIVPDNWQIPAE
ncbi:hypothetical protein POX_a00882 [Penicillium oxalicum]|uniref:hypothetical protein n=1 Tax=Penicillium oxalicum TaxID=69781 RepID=UPI0020B8938A|nr:hypothetical protein POX_a00882 [Penicillium oxalicum]KAI2794290.1 hypothetical protein POX_a00882 [Penicillium oxalicum]